MGTTKSRVSKELRETVREILADSLRIEVGVQFDEHDNKVITIDIYFEGDRAGVDTERNRRLSARPRLSRHDTVCDTSSKDLNEGERENPMFSRGCLEARAGIEPTYKDLQFQTVNTS